MLVSNILFCSFLVHFVKKKDPENSIFFSKFSIQMLLFHGIAPHYGGGHCVEDRHNRKPSYKAIKNIIIVVLASIILRAEPRSRTLGRYFGKD